MNDILFLSPFVCGGVAVVAGVTALVVKNEMPDGRVRARRCAKVAASAAVIALVLTALQLPLFLNLY